MPAANYHFTVTGADIKEIRQRWWDFVFFIIGVVVVVVSLFMLVKKYMTNQGFKWTDIKYVFFTILAANAGFQFFNKQQLAKRTLLTVNHSELIYWDAATKVQTMVLLANIENARLTYDEVLLVTMHTKAKHEISTEQWPDSKKAALHQWLKNQQTDVA